MRASRAAKASCRTLAPPPERLVQLGGVDAVQPDQLPGHDNGVAVLRRDDLERGRAELVSGRNALVDGRFDDAIVDFEDARHRFDAARARTASWPAAITGQIPVVGRTIDLMAGLADAASASAATGVEIATGIDQLPGGIEGLIGPDGAISLPVAARAGQLLAAAEDDIAQALRTL